MPKNTNNPFFDQALAGCKKAEAELKGAVKCLYIGPGEHGGGDEEAQIVADLITKKVDGIAVSPANAPAMANALKDAGCEQDPGPDLGLGPSAAGQGAARRLYRHAQLRHRRQHRQARHADQAQGRHDLHPVRRRGGGQPQRAHAGHPRYARRAPRAPKSPGARLTGQNGWKEADGCPLYTDDDFARANQQMEDILAKYPNLDAFTPTGGFPQFLPDAYAKIASKYKDKIASGALALVVADTLPIQIDAMKAGLSSGQVGQRPFEMGYKAMYALKDMKEGKPAPADPTYTGLDVCTPKTADTCVGGGK